MQVSRQVTLRRPRQRATSHYGNLAFRDVNAAALIALGFNRFEVRTAFTPPVTIDLNAPPDPATEELLRKVQPAITISGNLGQFEIAPYGKPLGISPEVKQWGIAIGLGVGATLLGLMLIGGALFRKK